MLVVTQHTRLRAPGLAMGIQSPLPMSQDSSPSDPLVGTLVDGRYRVFEALGAGGMGVVYRAEHLQLRRPVALKVLQRDLRSLPEIEKRFEREAQALAALGHPNIVTVLDYGWTEGTAYLAMELLRGKSLQELLAGGPPSPAQALDVERQLLRGLAFAHARGIVHRDLKPGNVFLHNVEGLGETVKILDFGLAKFLDPLPHDKEGLTRAGAVYGTPAYMAPEQVAGQPADLRSDVYSAGILLFELLTGRRPFEGSPDEMLRQHLVADVPALEAVRPDLVPLPALGALVRRALAKDPGNRFQDASAMLEALEQIPAPAATSTKRVDTDAPTVAVASTHERPRSLRAVPPRRLAIASLVVVGAIAAVTAWAITSSDAPTGPAVRPDGQSRPVVAVSTPTARAAAPAAASAAAGAARRPGAHRAGRSARQRRAAAGLRLVRAKPARRARPAPSGARLQGRDLARRRRGPLPAGGAARPGCARGPKDAPGPRRHRGDRSTRESPCRGHRTRAVRFEGTAGGRSGPRRVVRRGRHRTAPATERGAARRALKQPGGLEAYAPDASALSRRTWWMNAIAMLIDADHPAGDDDLRAESARLLQGALRQVAAGHAGRKPQVVLDA